MRTGRNAHGTNISAKDPESYDVKERCQAVPPGDLLPFFVCPATIRYRDFVNATFQLGKFGRYFRLKSEAVRLDRYFFQQVSTKNFVTSLHVGEIEVSKHVG